MNISMHPIFRKISIASVLNPALEIRGEKARSILSYAVAGVISHKTVRQQVMMENAADAREKAVQEYHTQFENMFFSHMDSFLREKYEITPCKKALLATGNRALQYLRDGQRDHKIERILTTIRSIIRERENKKYTPGGQVEHRYQLTNLVIRVYQTLQKMIQNGIENLSRFEGKSLNEIATILGISPVPLTSEQQNIIRQLDNPIKPTVSDLGTTSRLSTNALLPLGLASAKPAVSGFKTVIPFGTDVATLGFNTLGLFFGSQYTFILDQNVSYSLHGNQKIMPPGTKFTCVVDAFDNNNGQPYLSVIPTYATSPDGTRFEFAVSAQKLRVFVTLYLKIESHQAPVQQNQPLQPESQFKEAGKDWKRPIRRFPMGRLQPVQPFGEENSQPTQQQQARQMPNMSLFNVVSSASFNEDRDLKYITSMENADVGASIIPFWLQIRHARDYNQKSYSGKNEQGQICNAFATCVLNEKGFPYETNEQKEEFRRQKNDFCDTLTSDRQEQIRKLWENRRAPFSRLTADEIRSIENMLFKPLVIDVDYNTSPEKIVQLFQSKYEMPVNAITLADIQNNEEGTVVIEDSNLGDILSCNYVHGKHSATYFVAKSMIMEIWGKMKKIKIREMVRDGASEQDARKILLQFFQSNFESLHKIDDAQLLYREYTMIVTQKRLRSALTNVYDPKNKQYKTQQRLLVSTAPNKLIDKDEFSHIFMTDLESHRDSLIRAGVQAFSVDELEKMQPRRIEFSPSPVDTAWLKTQFADVLMALNCFLKYVQQKGDSSRVVETRHTKFIVNMYSKCFDHVSDEMSMDIDELPDIPKEFKELVFFEMGKDSLRYVWTYVISLYNARVLLRQKLSERGLKMESSETIDRVSMKFADEFMQTLDNTMFGVQDGRFFGLSALAFSSIIYHLRQYWKNNRSRTAQKFGQAEIDFAYHILSRQESANVDMKGSKNTIFKGLIERLGESWANSDDIPDEISERLYELVTDLYNNQQRFMPSIKTRLYYFATIHETVKDKPDVKEEMQVDAGDDEVVLVDDAPEHDDDQPEDGQDYDDEEDEDDDLFGDVGDGDDGDE